MGIGASFWWRDALPHQPVRIREETLESGNIFSGGWISTSVWIRLNVYQQPTSLPQVGHALEYNRWYYFPIIVFFDTEFKMKSLII